MNVICIKKLMLIFIVALSLTVLTGCLSSVKDKLNEVFPPSIDQESGGACEHVWLETVDTGIEVCYLCGSTACQVYGHQLVEDAGYEATCTASGFSTGSHCTVCKKTIASQEIINPKGHSYEIQNILAEADCTSNGIRELVCSVCDYSYREDIPALGHSYESVVTEPTCTSAGVTTYSCKNCDSFYTDNYTEATGHSYIEQITKKPTCTEDGIKEFSCSCGDIYSASMPAKGHEYKSEVTVPTCTEQGYTTYTCHCGEISIKDYIKANGHRRENATCTSAGECSVCGEMLEAALGHKPIKDIGKAPTCTAEGLSDGSHCERCGYIITSQKTIAAAGHRSVTDEAKAPTCMESGLGEGSHCSVCGEILSAQRVLEKLGHNFTGKTVLAPTCTENGEKKYTCQRSGCGNSYLEIVPPKGHDISKNGKITAPTCTEQGYTEYSCKTDGCGYSYKESYVDATGHDYTDVITVPTCTESGYTTHTCNTCAHVLVDSHTKALGHTEVIDKAVAPTCTEAGLTEGSHCSVCDTVFLKQSEVERLPHTYTDNRDGVCDACGTAREGYGDKLEFEKNSDGTYTVIGIGDYADTELVIPEKYNGAKVTAIADNAFANKGGLISVRIPETVEQIGFGAFSGCNSIAAMTLPFAGAEAEGNENTHFGYIFGAKTYKENGTYVPKSLKSVTVEGCTTIAGYAFSGCSSLTSFTIGMSITHVGGYAFEKCVSIKEVNFVDAKSLWKIDGGTGYMGSLLVSAANFYKYVGLYQSQGYKYSLEKYQRNK